MMFWSNMRSVNDGLQSFIDLTAENGNSWLNESIEYITFPTLCLKASLIFCLCAIVRWARISMIVASLVPLVHAKMKILWSCSQLCHFKPIIYSFWDYQHQPHYVHCLSSSAKRTDNGYNVFIVLLNVYIINRINITEIINNVLIFLSLLCSPKLHLFENIQ